MQGPMTIEAVVYNDCSSGNPILYHHRSFEGYRENIPQGAVRVELWVGQCSGYTLVDAHTGWESVSRIMIEEVSRPHSRNKSVSRLSVASKRSLKSWSFQEVSLLLFFFFFCARNECCVRVC